MWRFNLGGGSEEQGDASGIVSDKKERRVDCFLTSANGSYDWSKSAGRRYFMEKAKEYGCESFVLFSNTPPVYYTYNGQARSGTTANCATAVFTSTTRKEKDWKKTPASLSPRGTLQVVPSPKAVM